MHFVISGWIVVTLFILAFVVLFSIIVHLSYVARKEWKKENDSSVLYYMILTLVSIISFELALILTVACVCQVILLDGHYLDHEYHNHYSREDYHSHGAIFDIYYASFIEMEYLISVFDVFGHLCTLAVFIRRIQMCFKHSVFGYNHRIFHCNYICLAVLFSMSIVIIMEIIRDKSDVHLIIFTETVWELLIELMSLWLLYLFISKLYVLLSMSLHVTNSSNKEKHRSTVSVITSFQSHVRKCITPEAEMTASDSAKLESKKLSYNDTQCIDLVNIMNKMTLLVAITVISSIFSVAGNIVVQINELQTLKQHTINVQQLYAYCLPAIDTIITSVCLYLQFNFTNDKYDKLCYNCDTLFLKLCLKVHKLLIKTSAINNNETTIQSNVTSVSSDAVEIIVLPNVVTPKINSEENI